MISEAFENVDLDDSEEEIISTSDEEPSEEYGPLGYCDIEKEDQVGAYTIVSKLGWGHFSTVWKGLRSGKPYAVKVTKCDPHYGDMAHQEIDIYKEIRQRAHRKNLRPDHYISDLVDHFEHPGEHGLHVCLVFQVLGRSLYSVMNEPMYEAGVELPTARRLTQQLLKCVHFLHQCHYVHTDIKPENILFLAGTDIYDDSNWEIRLCDMGCAETQSEASKNDEIVQTRHYRAPEVILRHGYNNRVDIWSVGCVLFELLTGEILFDPEAGPGRRWKKNDDHLAMMYARFGPLPWSFLKRNEDTLDRYFNDDAQVKRRKRASDGRTLMDLLKQDYGLGREETEKEFLPVYHLMKRMFVYVPQRRPGAGELLKHRWFRE